MPALIFELFALDRAGHRGQIAAGTRQYAAADVEVQECQLPEGEVAWRKIVRLGPDAFGVGVWVERGDIQSFLCLFVDRGVDNSFSWEAFEPIGDGLYRDAEQRVQL